MQSHLTRRRKRLASCAWLSLCCAVALGCSGGEPSPPQLVPAGGAAPAKAGAPAAPAAAKPEASAAPRSANSRPPPQAEPNATAETDSDIPHGAAVFAILAEPDGQRFAIATSATIPERDRFAATPLGPNVDSTRFIALPATAAVVPVVSSPGNVVNANSVPPTNRGTFQVPEGFTSVAESGNSPEGLPWRLRCEKDDSLLALVPAGPFLLGKNDGPKNAAPQHGVYLDDYYIDVTEVSSGQYEKFREAQREAKKRVQAPARTAGSPAEPVTGVNSGEAVLYAHWAGKELPTEAQWEKAARGPNGFDHPWGNGPHLWHRLRERGQIDPVGSFNGDLSPFGVFDLAGNAREWCADWYAEAAYKQLLATGDSIPRNPTGPKQGSAQSGRVVRGGDSHWNVWTRAGVVQTERPADIGFRCVLNIKPAAAGDADPATKPKATKKPAAPKTGGF